MWQWMYSDILLRNSIEILYKKVINIIFLAMSLLEVYQKNIKTFIYSSTNIIHKNQNRNQSKRILTDDWIKGPWCRNSSNRILHDLGNRTSCMLGYNAWSLSMLINRWKTNYIVIRIQLKQTIAKLLRNWKL